MPIMTASPRLRFWSHVVRDPDSECWLWIGGRSKGYGLFKIAGRSISAHRFAYEEFVGPIPDGLELDHLCRTRCCVNPAHLEPVSSSVNKLRSRIVGKGRLNKKLLRCRNGHLRDVSNVNGRGRCVLCHRAAQARYKRRKAVSA